MSFVTFESLNLHPAIMRAVEEAGYTTPTPIQAKAIPEIMAGKDIMASAQTGTGKTAGFTLPALNLLATSTESKNRNLRILILVPTRELAAQVNDSARKYGKYLRARTVSIVGGMPYPLQNKLLSQPLDILVATPGRFIDHLERGRINLSHLEMFVLDEADRMLDMGFMPDVKRICAALPEKRQTLLFSATLGGDIGQIARDILHDPIKVQIAAQKNKHDNIEQRLHFVDDMGHKNKILEHLLIGPDVNQAIIFTSTKRHADLLSDDLYAAGHKTAALHGDMTQGARNRTLTKLRNGAVKALVATDVAARGIDVKGITHVINYDLPKFAEDYIHRIGRTGRANQKGIAIAFASNGDGHVLRKIEQFTGHKLAPTTIEGLEPKRPININSSEGKKRRGNRNNYVRNNKNGDNRRYHNGDSRQDKRNSDNGGNRNINHHAANNHKTPQRNQQWSANRAETTGKEINGNSVSYTKDTDMQFARELSRGFVDGVQVQRKPKRSKHKQSANTANRSTSFSNEKFGKPRSKNAGNKTPRQRKNIDNKRIRDFA